MPNTNEPNCCFAVRTARWRIPIYWGLVVPRDRLKLVEDELDRHYGPKAKRRSATYDYNCHGLTFSHRIGWIGVGRLNPKQSAWVVEGIETPQHADHIELLLEHSGYRRIARLDNVAIDHFKVSDDIKLGDVVVYKLVAAQGEEITHTGLVASLDKTRLLVDVQAASVVSTRYVEVLSKFGNGPEYFHSALDVPSQYGTVLEVWTDRDELR